MTKSRITPCLWFDGNAEEAVDHYMKVFNNSRILGTSRYLVETPSNKPKRSVMTIDFELNGQRFMALNGGPFFRFSEAISFVIYCVDQKEIDHFYDTLSAVPEAEMCGWIKDKFGVSWQLVTPDMDELMSGEHGERVMTTILKMKRIDVEKLRMVAAGK